MMATYVGVVGFLIFYFVLTALFQKPQYDHIVGLLEPFGVGAVQEVTKYWTTSDRNTMLPPFAGVMLYNRAIWFSLSFILLAIRLFKLSLRGARRQGRQSREKGCCHCAPPVGGALPAPALRRRQ